MIPPRCFDCGKVIGHLERRLKQALYKHRDKKDRNKLALDELGLKRLCCRNYVINTVPMADYLLTYLIANEYKPPNDTSAEKIVIHDKPRVPVKRKYQETSEETWDDYMEAPLNRRKRLKYTSQSQNKQDDKQEKQEVRKLVPVNKK
jgi:DNA-directed RNA polymerase subunit N (RpoN/RPB10)